MGTRRHASLVVRQPNDILGSGKGIPPGRYRGTIEEMVVMLHGFEKRQISRVSIPLEEKQVAEFLGVAPNPRRGPVEVDVTRYFKDGTIGEE